jgi:hypothetical protein
MDFHRRAKKAGVLTHKLRVVLWTMYASAAVVTIRCIYRLVEYTLGWDSTLYKHEVFFWVFEAGIMFLNSALLNVIHPGKRLPISNSTFLARDGVTEREGPGWGDDRPWLVTVVDPFDLAGLIRGKDEKTKFWDMDDATLEALRLEKKRNKRGVFMGLVDPLRLWGRRGYIGRYFGEGKKKRERDSEGVVSGTTLEVGKGSGMNIREST